MPPLAKLQEMPLMPDGTSLLQTAEPAQEMDSLGLGDKQVPDASPEREGNEPQAGGSGLQPAPNPVYS